MKPSILTKDGINFLVPFILITSCFALWGFANDMTGPIVKAFSKIFRMSVTEGALVQVAFYLGYFAMAFPAAMFIQRYSFKAGVLVGLSLFAIGSFMFFPAKMTGMYYPFLLAYFILTCGLSFLETSCNPYIYCMGSEETATQRLNLAQAFNPIGALMGMYIAMQFVQAKMSPMTTEQRMSLSDMQFDNLKDNDLSVLIGPYLGLGAVCLILLVLIRIHKMPKAGETKANKSIASAFRELLRIENYREGIIAQFFYVGAQVTCWTFIIQYGTRVFMEEGMDEKSAEILSQKYNIILHRKQVHLHMVPEIYPCRASAVTPCHCCNCFGIRRHSIYRPRRSLLSGGHIGLYVVDVPDHLWNSSTQRRRQCQVCWRRSHHGYPWRFSIPATSGSDYRL